MSLSAVRTALQTRLTTISGLTAYKEIPLAAGKMPAAIVDLEGVNYDVAMGGGSVQYTFRVVVLMAERDADAGFEVLDDYLAKSGSTSIKAAIEGGTVGDYVAVRRAENAGYLDYRGTTFIGAEFVVEVADSS